MHTRNVQTSIGAPDDLAEIYAYNHNIPNTTNSASLDWIPETIQSMPMTSSFLSSSSLLFGTHLSHDASVLSEHLAMFERAKNINHLPTHYSMPQVTKISVNFGIQVIDHIVSPLGKFHFLHDAYSGMAKIIYASLSPFGQARMGDGFFNMFSYPKVLEVHNFSEASFEMVDNTKSIDALNEAFTEKTRLTSKYVTGLSRLGTGLTIASATIVAGKIAASENKGETFCREVPIFSLGMVGGVIGSTLAGLSASSVCGPAAPGCALAYTIGASLAGVQTGTKIGEHLVGHEENPLDIKDIKTLTSSCSDGQKQIVCKEKTFHSGGTVAKCTISDSVSVHQNAANKPLENQIAGSSHTNLYLAMQSSQTNPLGTKNPLITNAILSGSANSTSKNEPLSLFGSSHHLTHTAHNTPLSLYLPQQTKTTTPLTLFSLPSVNSETRNNKFQQVNMKIQEHSHGNTLKNIGFLKEKTPVFSNSREISDNCIFANTSRKITTMSQFDPRKNQYSADLKSRFEKHTEKNMLNPVPNPILNSYLNK